MPAGPMKRKSIQTRLREIRAQAAVPPVWIETPGWVLGADDPSILLPYHEESGRLDPAALAAVTHDEYLKVIAAAVEAGEFPKWVDHEASWLRLLLYRDHGEHGGYCACPPCTARKPPAPPPQTAAPAARETYINEPGLDRRHPNTTLEERARDEEREERERARWRNAPVEWFTS